MVVIPLVGEGYGGLALPIGWDLRPADWLIGGRWLHDEFPRFERRSAAFVRRFAAALPRSDEEATERVISLVTMTLAQRPNEGFADFHEYRDAVCANAANPDLVRFFVTAIASLVEDDPPHPIIAGAVCCGWTMVPEPFVDVVIDLTVLLQYWHDGDTVAFRDRREFVPSDPVTEPTLRIDDGGGWHYRGPSRVQREQAALGRRRAIRAHLARLATPDAGIVQVAGGPRSGRRMRAAGSTLGTVLRRPDYYLRAMAMMDHRDPRTTRLYDAFADVCDSAHREPVEQAILRSVAGASAETRANAMMRAATRRLVAREVGACAELAIRAFGSINPSDVPTIAWMAAALAAVATQDADLDIAHSWATQAAKLAEHAHPVAGIGLAELMMAVCSARGDTLGHARAAAMRRALVDAHSVRPPPGMSMCPSLDLESSAFLGLEEIATDVAHARFATAIARLNAMIADVVETSVLAVARARVHAVREQLTPAITRRQALGILDTSGVAATIAAWLDGALADLHATEGDDASWEELKRRQLALEDETDAVPEHMALNARESDARPPALRPREFCCPPNPIETQRNALAYAVTEAEAAFAAGRMRQARLWTARAEELRARQRRR